ncbi:MAG: phospholipase D-like domain-containing protein, partial [Bradymonadaceae bacterium]
NTAALRGVEVDVIMPEENNLPFVQWASFGQLRPMLERDCRVWLTPPPFDHSKVMIVDQKWVLFGSANW